MIQLRMKILLFVVLAVSVVWFVSCSRDGDDAEQTESVGLTETSVIEETTVAMTDVTQTVPEEEEIPVYLHPDGREFADLFADYDKIGYGCIRAYWDTGSQRVLFEAVFDDEWNRYLYINGHEVFKNGFFMLSDIRVTDDYIIVVTSGTDVNSHHLYLFDFAGQLLYETYYLTDHGMIFQSLEAVEADRILLFGTRLYHGPSLLMPDSEKVFSGAYASYLYEDPISDVMESEEVTADNFGEVPLYPDRASVDPNLNPDLVLGGVYALPYLGDGQFGKIEHVETIQTLGSMLDELYGE